MPNDTTVQRLGKRQLLRAFSDLVDRDRGTTATMLAYIGEIDRRQLYLESAYPSMFAYCTKHFRMSESIASKRIRAGRTACRFPLILRMIRKGELHLSGVHQLASYLTEENHKHVLRRAKYRSMREIEELIVEIAPRPDGKSIIRTMPEDRVSKAHSPSSQRNDDAGPSQPLSHGETHSGIRGPSQQMPANRLRNVTVPLSPRRYRLHVTIGPEARRDLEELQNLLSHQFPNGDPAPVVERALQLLLAETKKKRAALTDRPRKPRRAGAKRTRSIPAAVRRQVFERDEGVCAFVDRNGRRCRSAWQVEFHHVVPYGREGPHTAENVELRCRAHNQYQAGLDYGWSFRESRTAKRR